MKTLPQPGVDAKPLFDLLLGATRSQALMSAVDLKIFNHTTGAVTAAEVSTAIGAHAGNVELFMNALCGMGLLQKKDGKFSNTQITDTFLVEGRDTCLVDFLFLNDNWMFQNRDQMREALLNGPTPPMQEPNSANSNEEDDLFQAQSILAMRNFARSGAAQKVGEELSKLPEFSEFKEMLDLGGAHGLDCVATVQKHPTLQGTVFDKPHIIAKTEEIIREYGMEDRIKFIGGDCVTDPIGEGYDLIHAKGMLNFTGPALGDVIAKIYNALNPGGVFVSIHDGLTEEKTQPEDLVVSWLSSALSMVDVTFEQHEIPEAMERAGFKGIESKPYYFPLGHQLAMVVGRK